MNTAAKTKATTAKKSAATRKPKAVAPADRKKKACTRCGKVKPMDSFQKNATHADGRQTRCRACMSEVLQERKTAQAAS